MEELFDIYDAQGNRIGTAPRRECHGNPALIHCTAHVAVRHPVTGALLLQKRRMDKDIQPGKWDTAVGGHLAYGESILEAVYREASEELGLMNFNPIYIETYEFESPIEREMVNVFAAVGTYELHPDLDEVDEGRWWELSDIDASIGKGVFTPNFESEFTMIRSSLLALL